MRQLYTALILWSVFCAISAGVGRSQDWSQWGGSSLRNNVASGEHIPSFWDCGKFDRTSGAWIPDEAKNIKWVAQLGSQTYRQPVVAQGRIFVGTNNDAGYLQRYPDRVDLGCLLCFRESDGKFLWQYSSEKLATGRVHDMPMQGIVSSPLVEGNRLWFVNNRNEVVCADTEGFYDSQDDGPHQGLAGAPPATPTDNREADVVWTFDMMGELGVRQHNLATCCITSWGDTIFICTGNGVDATHVLISAPEAPSFIALDKHSGRLLWTDRSPGINVLHGQWSSAAVAELGGVPQVVFGGGDGWLYSFRADRWQQGAPELLWKFDANRKDSKFHLGGTGTRNNLLAIPVIYQGLVYVSVGHDPEHGEGIGHLWCIDPTRRGDVSPELVVGPDGKTLPHFRYHAAAAWGRILELEDALWEGLDDGIVSQALRGHFERAGFALPPTTMVAGRGRQWMLEAPINGVKKRFRLKRERHAKLTVELETESRVIPNPNSALVWHHAGSDADGDGTIQSEEQFHRSVGSVAIKDDLLFACDIWGIVHCLDAKTGRAHWTCDLLAACWGSPLIVDNKVYVADEDGDVAIFQLSADPDKSLNSSRATARNGKAYWYHQPKQEVIMNSSVYSTPSVANNVLYIADRSRLFAIATAEEEEE